ncbi:MAG: dNTP triphosphohydrolase [Candidatus Sericytochromatia bacterium]|nr:dNTP triphosphohydrolase [Candidatus Sericytochromatia bacterium]
MSELNPKHLRRHPEDKRLQADELDYRPPGQKDRDRLLFCSAFRRLAGVTQVVSAQEGHIFHNRLTHSLKVAQIARALALKLQQSEPRLLQALGGIDPDIAETAALAHDLGHPPFGHIAENKLNALAQSVGLADGFEGNAQSFRIVTRLAVRKAHFGGLNLTRGSLNALLKYPWLHGQHGPRSHKKWNAYHSDAADFAFAREGMPAGSTAKCLEAELMDWADDIAYSIHDVEDFYRAGLIPLDRLVGSLRRTASGEWEVLPDSETDRFLKAVFTRWAQEQIQAEFRNPESEARLSASFVRIISQLALIQTPFDGSHRLKAYLRDFTSLRVSRYINAFALCDPEAHAGQCIQIQPEALLEVKMLKELTWQYVMRSPALTAQKYGQNQLIETLFAIFHSAALSPNPQDWDLFPFSFREQLEATSERDERARIVVDLIAGMTEAQAVQIYQRLTGAGQNSVFLPILS